MLRPLFFLAALLATGTLFAQLPSTQVYVFDYVVRDSAVRLTNPQYLTAFNDRGYNNQPSWIDRDRLMMSVQTPRMEQPDIFEFNLATGSKTRLTATPSGEYSPQPTATGNKFTVVRQEFIAGDTVQRLWEFPLNLSNNGKPVFKYITDVGYYEWLNSIQVAMYLVRNPSVLAMANAEDDSSQQLGYAIGRCIKRQKSGNLAYVDKRTRPWMLVERNLYRLRDNPVQIVETLQGSEDFAILADGSYLMGKGSQLYRYDPVNAPRWIQIADLRLYGIRDITRIEASESGRFALVSNGSR